VLAKLWRELFFFTRIICFTSTRQFFLAGHSTVFQLIETYHSIVKSIDDGKSCCMVFCDLSKAFDRVWHKGLLFKLQTYGITGNLFYWFKSYLSDRKQKVIYKNISSPSNYVNAGVPQCSVLGPLLSLIYVNDVSDNMSMCRLFADDNSIQYPSDNVTEIEHVINHDSSILNSWSKQWLLQFNPSKTKTIFFTLKKTSAMPNLVFQHNHFEHVQSLKHLGLILSSDLGWSLHINNIVNNAYRITGLLKKLKFVLRRNVYCIYWTPLRIRF
jgi:hypothetical protein